METELLPRLQSSYSFNHTAIHPPSLETAYVTKLDFEKDLNKALRGAFPATPRQYTEVTAVLLSWDQDDLGCSKEIDDLESLFQHTLGFNTEYWIIHSQNKYNQLERKISDLKGRHQSSSELIIVYYGGHGEFDDYGRSIWRCNTKDQSPALDWYDLQPFFERAIPDVLFIFDCCYAACAARGLKPGTKELLAACGRESTTVAGIRSTSFTAVLIQEIKRFGTQSFSVVDLHSRPIKERQVLRKTPIYARLSKGKYDSIVLSPLLQPPATNNDILSGQLSSDTMPQNSNQSEGGNSNPSITPLSSMESRRVLISVSLADECLGTDPEDWLLWLTTNCPRNIGGLVVQVEGIYASDSTLLLISLPVSVWDLLPDNPAYSFVGFVKSGNLRADSRAANATTIDGKAEHGSKEVPGGNELEAAGAELQNEVEANPNPKDRAEPAGEIEDLENVIYQETPSSNNDDDNNTSNKTSKRKRDQDDDEDNNGPSGGNLHNQEMDNKEVSGGNELKAAGSEPQSEVETNPNTEDRAEPAGKIEDLESFIYQEMLFHDHEMNEELNEESVEDLRALALALAVEDSQSRNSEDIKLASSIYFFIFLKTRTKEDLHQAIIRAEESLSIDCSDRAACLINFSRLLAARYNVSSEVEDIELAARLTKEAVDHTRVDHSSYASRSKHLVMLLAKMYERTNSVDYRQQAILAAENAIFATAIEHPNRAEPLVVLATILFTRYDRVHSIDDLLQATLLAKEAMEATSRNNPKGEGTIIKLRTELTSRLDDARKQALEATERFDPTRGRDEFEGTIHRAEQAVEVTNEGRPIQASILGPSRIGRVSRYEQTGMTEDLEEAVTNAQKAVNITPQGHPDLARMLSNLGISLFMRYGRTGKIEDLEEAITNTQRVIDIISPDYSDLASVLSNLSGMLFMRYKETGKTGDLEEAITNARRAVDITPKGHPGLAGMLSHLDNILSSRYNNRTGKIEDLEEAITSAQRAVNITPQGHPDLPSRLNSLGGILIRRYERTGKTEDLEEAITNIRRAVDITPQDDSGLASMLGNLSGILFRRYEQTGNTGDLEEAITNTRRAVDIIPQGHPDLAGILGNLGSMLSGRNQRTGNTEDLEEAITNAQKAVDITPQGHPDLARMLNNLGTMLLGRNEQTGKTEDLEEAITNIRRAVDITPKGHPGLASMLSNLGNMLSSRYKNGTGKIENLEEAITSAQRAVNITPQGHPDRAGMLKDLGNMLSSRYRWTRNANDRDAALNCYLESSECHGAIPLHRITAARQAIRLLAEQNNWQKASSLAHEAVKLLPMVCGRYLSREDQQRAISQTSGLAADACSLSLRTDNDPDRALEYLEHGRGLILGYLIDGRGDISELKKDSPEKAEEFDKLRFKAVMPIRTDELPDIQQLLREREEAARDLENCLQDIRQLPGHERFFLPPSSDALKGYAADGPIVVVNVTNISSDALIVLTSGIKAVRLPELHGSKINQYRPWNLTRCATRDAELVGEQKDDNTFRGFLARLWSDCVRLVLDELGFYKTSINLELPRIWWIGTGLAGSLPFHAAGDHSVDSVENTLSYAISSYTPTIKALRHAREKARIEFDKHSVLLVTMPKTPGEDDLPGVESEQRAICDAVKNPHSVQLLIQPSADTVLEKLRDCSIVHFACHGSSDLMDPANSFLALQGNSNSVPDKLTVQRIFDANLGQAWLAYLSACSTAENKVAELTDEALHLASSFQIAGFGHVVASMWPSNDAICAQVASIFYRDLMMRGGIRGGNRAVAAALHAAVREVRSQNIEQPYLWAQYIHSGA